jgi:hypothetical protein
MASQCQTPDDHQWHLVWCQRLACDHVLHCRADHLWVAAAQHSGNATSSGMNYECFSVVHLSTWRTRVVRSCVQTVNADSVTSLLAIPSELMARRVTRFVRRERNCKAFRQARTSDRVNSTNAFNACKEASTRESEHCRVIIWHLLGTG